MLVYNSLCHMTHWIWNVFCFKKKFFLSNYNWCEKYFFFSVCIGQNISLIFNCWINFKIKVQSATDTLFYFYFPIVKEPIHESFYILFTQETDAALMTVISFPAFAVDDPEIIALTHQTIKEKLEVSVFTMCQLEKNILKML